MVDTAKSALVVVDVQRGFLRDCSRHVLPVIVDLVRRWPGGLVLTRYVNPPGSPYERLLHWDGFRGPPATDLAPELLDAAGHATVITKEVYTLFTTEGEQLVRDRGWTDLYLCGIATEYCVLKTAIDAFERGLTPWLIEDACASHENAHEEGLRAARRFIGAGQIIRAPDIPM
ncbi:isochorismatase family cysteine hydrolase [Actinomadura rudentiformis]|uniref:Cysteine hydrolase n=1 Tax=Actinomadura rudentiformis TaxID=359158 RepID=A0A6H9YI74_9ACTN|nr:isochorismatase family cysteine hydrolase [Actinomadura rudentiformis]KAB2339337.1 cysteine hydrolase [Actinomadura rudentiformis]